MRVPGILAGLNERSQSAYAMPAPKPVLSATGHARPEHVELGVQGQCASKESHEDTHDGRE